MRVFALLLLTALLAAAMFGCESRTSANVYAREQAQRVQKVDHGQIVGLRHVQIEGSTTGLGSIAGGVLGGALGSTIGQGSGQDVATVAGVILGAVLGAGLEEDASHQAGQEITVQLDSGEVIAIVQATDQQFDVGDRVRIHQLGDGSARVVPSPMVVRASAAHAWN